MTHKTAFIVNKTISLSQGESATFTIDSDEWFLWLENARSFAYVLGESRLTVRKQKQGSYTYWYGYLKHAGRLHCVYVGSTLR